MTKKRFKEVYPDIIESSCSFTDNGRGITHKEVCEILNNLHEENQRLKDRYERKDRQLKRTKKDIEKYTDYFMNELEWDCDRIIQEVFR